MSGAEATRTYLDGLVRDSKIPGIQYLVVVPEGIAFEYAGGWADLAGRRQLNAGTTMMAYSMSKTITAAAVLLLVEAQKVELDDPIDVYLESQPYGSDVTVRQLLSHTSGIPNPIPLRWVHPATLHEAFDERAALARVLREHPKLSFPPGTKYKYSNIGYWLLGRIYEQDYEKRVVPCKLFYHHYADGGNMSEFGYRDSDRMVFVFDKEKLRGELISFREKLNMCPFFPRKKLDKLIDGIPVTIDPAQDNEWSWMDSDHRTWIFDGSHWISGWGDPRSTPPSDAVTVCRIDRDERRRIEADFRKGQTHEAELQASLAAFEEESKAVSRKKGCLGLVVSILVGAGLLSLILVILL